jgi:valyl-tRNA synthetase
MPLDLPSSYSAATVEADVYRRWENAGCFKAGAGRRDGKPSYTIAIPPPNVTGVLHMGHALNNTLQDTLIRWRRMQGYDTLWQPGTDHAGIATESVVVKHIQAEGLTRDGLGREAFLKRVWAWKEQSGGAITQQLRKLGSSCDWSRERFTMDEGLSHAVRVQFTKLYEAGLIYRGTRMVNWCPVQKTALADDEVEVIEKQGFLWALKYDFADGSGSITVETTRPETFFGDTAVAVNPDDARYQHLIGKMVRLPIIGREIPIVADSYANPEKGSGAVKITPAHDPNDYELGKRHNLPLIRVIDFDGTMTKDCAQFAGLERFAARKALLREFEATGVLLGSTEIKHAVGHSYRSNAPIEPMVTEQWFVKMDSLAKKALEYNHPGGVEFHPERWTKVYAHWLENTRDWCISRQIWWGHRIPAWRCASCGKYTVAVTTPTACEHCAGTALAQETDVLDTWFSSALWPFSTLGWPEQTPELARYFPTSTLVTDRGIIFFWVARMVMASCFALDQKPFSDVYIHGTVLDERGVKMSKSLGNGIDPIIMIDGGTQNYLGKDYQCPGYGADAIRYTLLDMTTEGQDLKLSPAKFETGRNFANKVWNAGRFLLMNLNERPLPAAVRADDLVPAQLGFAEQWILERLAQTTEACTQALTAFRFNDYSNGAYRFFRDDLCDWYLEWAKRQFKQGGSEAADAGRVLSFCVDQVLRLLHPGMPFITEFLWQQLQGTTGGTPWSGTYLMTDAWPEPVAAHRNPDLGREMGELQAVVVAVRNARNLLQLGDGIQLAVEIHAPVDAERRLLEANREFVSNRANLSALTIAASGSKPAASVSTAVGGMKIHIPVSGIADIAKLSEQLTRRVTGLEKSINGKLSRLENADYLARAPATQVVETRELVLKEQVELANVRETLAGL